MTSLVFKLAGFVVSTQFGPTPISSEVEAGSQAFLEGKPWQTIMAKDRSFISYRNEAPFVLKGSEEVIWLSPSLVSRWMGYRMAREGWTPEELNQNWNQARQFCGNGATFLVKLVAVPKANFFSDDQAASNPAGTILSRASLYFSGNYHGLLGSSIAKIQSRDRSAVDLPWFGASSLKSLFAPLGWEPSDPGIEVGDHYCNWYLLKSPTPLPEAIKGFEVSIVAGSKSRRAKFSTIPEPVK